MIDLYMICCRHILLFHMSSTCVRRCDMTYSFPHAGGTVKSSNQTAHHIWTRPMRTRAPTCPPKCSWSLCAFGSRAPAQSSCLIG